MEAGTDWVGELIQVHEARERDVGVNRDWQPRLLDGRYMDHYGRIGNVWP